MEQIGLTHGGEKAQVQSVLLLTDGLANQGISSKEGILAEMKKMQDQGLHAVSIPQDAPSMDDVFGLHFGPPQMQNRRAQRGPPIQFQNRGLFGLPVQQGPATPHVGQLQQPNVVQIPTQQQASSPSPIPQLQTSNLLGGSVQQGPPPPPVQQLQLTPPPPPVPQLQTANIVQVPIQQQMGISALPPPPAPHTVQQQPATDTTKSVPPGAKVCQ